MGSEAVVRLTVTHLRWRRALSICGRNTKDEEEKSIDFTLDNIHQESRLGILRLTAMQTTNTGMETKGDQYLSLVLIE